MSDIRKLIDVKLDNVRLYEVLENKYRIKIGVQSEETFEIDEVYILQFATSVDLKGFIDNFFDKMKSKWQNYYKEIVSHENGLQKY